MTEFYFRAPRYAHLPHVCTLLDSIGSDKAIARLLGLTPGTIKRYRKDGQAPKPVMYALFWESPWGRETVDIGLLNEARFSYVKAQGLELENKTLRKQIAALEARLSEGLGQASNHDFFRIGGQ